MLRWKLLDSLLVRLLLLGVLLISTALIGRHIILTRFLRNEITNAAAQQQLALASYVAQEIDHRVGLRQERMRKLRALASPQALQRPAQLGAWIASVQTLQDLFPGGLLIADFQGKPLTRSEALSASEIQSLFSQDALRTLHTDAVYTGLPFRAAKTAAPVLPFMLRLGSAKGSNAVLIGLAHLSKADFMGNLLHGQLLKSTSGFLIVSPQDKLLIASSQPETMLKPTPPAGVNLLYDRAMTGYRGTGVAINAQGEEEIAAMTTLRSTGWLVVAHIPTSAALVTVTHAQDFMYRNAWISISIFLPIFVMVLYFLLRPLIRASVQAEKITLGLAPMQPLPVRSHDEVGALVRAFNRLLPRFTEQKTGLLQTVHHDALTGLPSRALLIDRLNQALAHAARHHTEVALLCLHLNLLKPAENSLSDEARNDVLLEAARRLSIIVRDTDSVSHVGGQEFVILLSEISHPGQAAVERVAQQIITAVEPPFAVAGAICQLGVSIGCVIGDSRSSPETLLTRADQLMHRAKAQGKGRYVMEGQEDSASPT